MGEVGRPGGKVVVEGGTVQVFPCPLDNFLQDTRYHGNCNMKSLTEANKN